MDAEVILSIREVFAIDEPRFDLVDDLGVPWTPAEAQAQLSRLGIV